MRPCYRYPCISMVALLCLSAQALAAAKPSIEIYPEALVRLQKQQEAMQATPPTTTPTLPPPLVFEQPPVVSLPPHRLVKRREENPPTVITPAVTPASPPIPAPVVTEPAAIAAPPQASETPSTPPPPAASVVDPAPTPVPAPDPLPTPQEKLEISKGRWWNSVTDAVGKTVDSVAEVLPATRSTPEPAAAQKPEVKSELKPEIKPDVAEVAPPAPAPAPVPEPKPEPKPKRVVPDLSNAPKNLPSMAALIGDEQTQKEASASIVREGDLPKPDASAPTLTAGELKPKPAPQKRLKPEPKPAKKPETPKKVRPPENAAPLKTQAVEPTQLPTVEVSGERVSANTKATPPPPVVPENKPAPEPHMPPAEALKPSPNQPPAANQPPNEIAPPQANMPPEIIRASALVKFLPASRELTNDGSNAVNAFAAKAKNSNQKIIVTGHGTGKGETWRRETLSQVLAVRSALMDKGIESGRITVQVETNQAKANQVDVVVR